ncbi:hypothetical protein D3C80_671800 [compost metagenome]
MHVQPGIGYEKIGDGRGQVAATERGRRVDADQAFRGVAQRYRFRAGQAQLFDDPSGAFGKGIAGRSWPYRMGAAHEQAAADCAFQGVDTPRHRRRRQRMTPGGGGEAAGFQNIKKQAELFGQGIGVHAANLLLRKWHSHCALLCVSPLAPAR